MPVNSSSDAARPLPLTRLVFVGAIVPAIFAVVDQWLMQRMFQAGPSRDLAAAELMAVLVVQVGLLGVLCGRMVEPGWLRWVIYGWGLVLMDLHVIWLADSWTISLLRSSLLAAQVGLVTVWAILGGGRWVTRVPVVLAVAAIVCLPLLGPQVYFNETWSLFGVQTGALCLICGVLRSQRFRLGRMSPPTTSEQTGASAVAAPPVQFGLRDLLFWMTALAVILAMAQGTNWLILTTGILAAIVLVAALWAALGKDPAWLRWPLFALIAVSAGIVFTVGEYFTRVSNSTWSGLSDWRYMLRYHWEFLAWPPLAGGLLAAALLIFRTLGYRLSRVT